MLQISGIPEQHHQQRIVARHRQLFFTRVVAGPLFGPRDALLQLGADDRTVRSPNRDARAPYPHLQFGGGPLVTPWQEHDRCASQNCAATRFESNPIYVEYEPSDRIRRPRRRPIRISISPKVVLLVRHRSRLLLCYLSVNFAKPRIRTKWVQHRIEAKEHRKRCPLFQTAAHRFQSLTEVFKAKIDLAY